MQGQFTWAMAGRSKTKMEQVRSGLVPDSAKLADVELLEANVSDQASMDALAASASVIITTVGPYASYGRPLVEVSPVMPNFGRDTLSPDKTVTSNCLLLKRWYWHTCKVCCRIWNVCRRF